ncbi:MAG: flavin reductase family protein [Phycisphaerales bacterium JB052]
MSEIEDQVIETALGCFPGGLYLMTAAFDDQRGGMLVHSVQCCGTEPAMLCIAARKGHQIDPLIRDSRSFALGVLGSGDRLIERRFRGKDSVPSELASVREDDPFDAIETTSLVTGSPIIPRCDTWFDCEVMRRVDLEAELELFVGLVVGVLSEGRRVKIDRVSDSFS